MALLKQLEHLKISLDVIKLATNNFGAENFVGVGGFGKVYKGDITSTEGITKTVAIKRLDRQHGQGEHEFLMEIMMLSRYRHKNLVSLLGFCDEGDEKILVYMYEFNGSLEKYLSSSTLTWVQRLKICIGAARGLEYLHNPLGTQQRVLHRDVKSANILLDQFWEAKIADFGLSKIGPANQEYTFLVSNAVGTFGYCDPLYAETNILTKESDVYSFGVVLFEVLCGRLCVGKPEDGNRLLTKLAQQSYEQGTLDGIILHGLREQIEPNSLRTYSSAANRCLRRDREERPTMAQVLAELELALEYQENIEAQDDEEDEEQEQEEANVDGKDGEIVITWTEDDQTNLINLGILEIERNQRLENLIARRKALRNLKMLADKKTEIFERGKPMEYEELIQMADREHPLVYTNKIELELLLRSGILVDWGRRWFSLSKNEHNCEMISASEFSLDNPEIIEWVPHQKSRFSEVAKIKRAHDLNIEVDIETVFLSPGITYAAYLVFKYCDDDFVDSDDSHVNESREAIFVGLQYKFKDADESSFSYLADWTDNGWMIIELCQFVSYKRVTKLQVLLEGISGYHSILLEGIQFMPVNMSLEEEPIQVDNSYTMDPKWERKLPSDYLYIIKSAKDHVPYNITNKEIYMLLSNGILTNRGRMFFSLDKDGIKCCMLSARAILEDNQEMISSLNRVCFRWISLHESRFEKVAECQSGRDLLINCRINSHMLSPNTTYATYLVYKLPEVSDRMFECPLEVKHSNRISSEDDKVHFIFLISPKSQLIEVTKGHRDCNQRRNKNPLHRPRMEGSPRQRKDGWMEAQIWTFTTDVATSTINKKLDLSLCKDEEQLTGLIVQGIEIRPKQIIHGNDIYWLLKVMEGYV